MATTRQKERRRISAQETAEQQDAGFDMTSMRLPEGANLFNVKAAGVRRLEVIAYVAGAGNPNAEEGDDYFMRTFFTHRDVGPNRDVYVCPAKTAGLPCPVCEYRAQLERDPNADPNTVKALRPKKRQLWNIYDHGDPERGVQIWDVSYHLFGKALFALIRDADDDDNYQWFADPVDGSTLKIGFAEKTWEGNTFREASTIVFKNRAEPLGAEILGGGHCLDNVPLVLDYDKLRAIFEGDEDAAPAATKPAAASKPAPAAKPAATAPAEAPAFGAGDQVKVKGIGPCTLIKISADGKSATVEDGEEDYHKVKITDVKPAGKAAPKAAAAAPVFTAGDTVKAKGVGVCKIIKISKDGLTATVEDDEEDYHKVQLADLKPAKPAAAKPAAKPAPVPDDPPRDEDDPNAAAPVDDDPADAVAETGGDKDDADWDDWD